MRGSNTTAAHSPWTRRSPSRARAARTPPPPRRRVAVRTPEAISRSGSGSSGRAAIAASTSSVRLATTVGAHGGGRRGQVGRMGGHGHAVGGGVARDQRGRARRDLDRVDRPEAEPRRGDGEDPAAGAPVAQPAAALELEQQLEAELGRRVRAGAELLARVDHDLQRPVVAARRLPRRADPQPPRAAGHLDRREELVPAASPSRAATSVARHADQRVAGSARSSSSAGSSAGGA